MYAACYIEGVRGLHLGAACAHLDHQVGHRRGRRRRVINQQRPVLILRRKLLRINDCTVEASPGTSLPSGSAYLGHTWRELAHVCFQECTLSDIVNGAGLRELSSSSPNTEDATFQAYDNSRPGASFATDISAPLPIATILSNDYSGWIDTSYLWAQAEHETHSHLAGQNFCGEAEFVHCTYITLCQHTTISLMRTLKMLSGQNIICVIESGLDAHLEPRNGEYAAPQGLNVLQSCAFRFRG